MSVSVSRLVIKLIPVLQGTLFDLPNWVADSHASARLANWAIGLLGYLAWVSSPIAQSVNS